MEPVDIPKTNKYENSKIYGFKQLGELVYVGSTTRNLYQRFHEHKSQSNHPDSGHACAIHRAIHENGLDEFEMVLIENFPCTNVSELRVREQYYMNLFKPEYNVWGAIHDKENKRKTPEKGTRN